MPQPTAGSARPWIRVCAYCDAVRMLWPDGTERWVRQGPTAWPDARRSHGICPRCFDRVVAGLAARSRRDRAAMSVDHGGARSEKGVSP
jgi:hypothetical protein